MHLDNQIPLIKRPIIPKILKDKINVVANCKLQEQEIHLFNMSLQCVANHLVNDNINFLNVPGYEFPIPIKGPIINTKIISIIQ